MSELRVLSVYEGFFAGGARILHSGVIAALHGRFNQRHSVLSIHRELRRESLRQNMTRDGSYRLLRAAGLDVSTLGGAGQTRAFTAEELARATRHLAEADVVISLKEQPLRLITARGLPRRPIIVCLHRSDPQNQGPALRDLRLAITSGRVVAVICCAESTRAAYAATGVPDDLLHVVPNGADHKRFRPAGAWTRSRLRRTLELPTGARVVAFAARHDPMKNVPLFLRAAREYLSREPDGVVVACGAGMSRSNPLLKEELKEVFGDNRALLSRLRLLGVRPDVESVYRAADVVTLTSAVGEAAPLALIEGMLCGAVPVTTDVGDCASIVDGRGLVVPPDAVAIADGWVEAVARREEYLTGVAGDVRRFSHRRMVRSYSEIIARVRQNLRAGWEPSALAPA